MIYEINLKIRTKNEKRELSYYEVWRIECKSFMPYEKPILETVFKQEWKLDIPPPEPNDFFMVLVEAKTSSSKDETKAFATGRNLIRDYLSALDEPLFLIYREKDE